MVGDLLARRNCTDLDRRPRASAAITGTDASDWGTGQLAWLDGQRTEVQLRFSPVEQAWSINARELLGILRVVQFYGEQLQGSAGAPSLRIDIVYWPKAL